MFGLIKQFRVEQRRQRFNRGFMYVWHAHYGNGKPLADLFAEAERVSDPDEFEYGMTTALTTIATISKDRKTAAQLDENRISALHYRSALETIAEGQCDAQVLARHTLDYVAMRLKNA